MIEWAMTSVMQYVRRPDNLTASPVPSEKKHPESQKEGNGALKTFAMPENIKTGKS